MSEENVEKTRAFIDAYNRRDFDAAVESFHPAIDWVLPGAAGVGLLLRPGGDKALLGQDRRDDGGAAAAAPGVRRRGGPVATRLRHYGRGRESGVVIDEELYHQVATFRDGTIVRMEYFAAWDEAVAAAEISD